MFCVRTERKEAGAKVKGADADADEDKVVWKMIAEKLEAEKVSVGRDSDSHLKKKAANTFKQGSINHLLL